MNHFFRRLIVCILLFPFIVEAQNYKAVVLSSAGQALAGAKVFYKSDKHSSETNSEGEFFFPKEHAIVLLAWMQEFPRSHQGKAYRLPRIGIFRFFESPHR